MTEHTFNDGAVNSSAFVEFSQIFLKVDKHLRLFIIH